MVKRITGQPVIQFHFSSDGNTVVCGLSVKLKRLDLKSGELVFAPNLWDQDVISRLAELEPRLESWRQAILDAREKRSQISKRQMQITKERNAIQREAGTRTVDRNQGERARIESAGGEDSKAQRAADERESMSAYLSSEKNYNALTRSERDSLD